MRSAVPLPCFIYVVKSQREFLPILQDFVPCRGRCPKRKKIREEEEKKKEFKKRKGEKKFLIIDPAKIDIYLHFVLVDTLTLKNKKHSVLK